VGNFIKACIRERKITFLLAALVFIFGLYQYYLVPKQENPQIDYPGAMITTIYPGASPEMVEKQVSKKLENEVSKIEGFKYVESYSQNSVSILLVMLHNDADRDKAWDQLRQYINDAESKLPEGIEKPVVNTKLDETAGIILSFSGEAYSYEQLADFAEVFEKELLKVNGVERFEMVGKLKKEVKVEIKGEKLVKFGMSLNDVYDALKAQNLEIPSGSIKNKEFHINVNTPGRFESLRDIENVVVRLSEDGGMTRIKDLGVVYMGLEDGACKIRRNGENAVILCGYFKKGQNIVLIGKEVRKVLDRIKSDFPKGLKINEVSYLPEDIENSVNTFMSSLLQSVVFVIIVVFLGMGLRNAIVVSIAIPLSIAITFICMNAFKIQIDQISTAALIIALGMLVDNAIVIADAIQLKIDNGQDNYSAAFDGAKESALPVFSATLTTMAAFLPLLLLPGVEGDYLYSIPVLVMVSLFVSFIVAMLVIPAAAGAFFVKSEGLDRTGKLRKIFMKFLERAFLHKKAAVFISATAFMIALLLGGLLNLQFFPPVDKALIYMNLISEKNNLEYTGKVTGQVEEILRRQEQITGITASVGDSLPTFYDTVGKEPKAKNFAQILCNVDLNRKRKFKTNLELAQHLQTIMDKNILGGKVTVKVLELTETTDAPVRVRISGDSIERIFAVARQMKRKVSEIEGTINVRDDIINKEHEFVVRVDEKKANSMGMTKYDIQTQINLAVNGGKATSFDKATNSYDVVVKSDIGGKEKLENLLIKSSQTGVKALLKQIGKIYLEAKTQLIKRYKKEINYNVISNVMPGYSAVDIENIIEREILPGMNLGGVTITFDGEREEIERGFGNLGTSALLAVFIIYIILLIQFKSFTQPLIIMITIPLSLIGCILGLLMTGVPLSFTGFLGIASLAGIVVNNAILLLEHIGMAGKEGKELDDACKEAVFFRIRPITLSTVTTVIGLVPMVYQGNASLKPMAITLMSGLMFSTVLTIVIVPTIYSLVEKKILMKEKCCKIEISSNKAEEEASIWQKY
jgi:multidrug efflux pump